MPTDNTPHIVLSNATFGASLLGLFFLSAALPNGREPAGFTFGIAVGHLFISALICIVPMFLWRKLTKFGKSRSISIFSNIFCITIIIVWIVFFIIFKSVPAAAIPILSANNGSSQRNSTEESLSTGTYGAFTDLVPSNTPIIPNSAPASSKPQITRTITVTLWDIPSCGDWLDQRLQLKSKSAQRWLIGYLSGRVSAMQVNTLSMTDRTSVFYKIDSFCRANPLKDVEDGAKELLTEIGPSK